MRLRLILLAVGVLVESFGLPLRAHTSPPVLQTPPSQRTMAPLAFEENLGQSDPHVVFTARGSNYTLFLTARDAVVARGGDSVRLAFRDARATRLSGVDRLAGAVNYLVGDRARWRTGIAAYGKVRYDNLYPGIDLVFYGNDRQLEYDLIVKPGADPRTIRLDLAGADALTTAADGSLIARTGQSELRLHPPAIYQLSSSDAKTRVAVSGRYRIDGDHTVAFDVDSYDRRRPLVIDPVVVYATYLSGDGSDDARWGAGPQMIAVDAAGSAYVTGLTDSSDFPTTAGVLQPLHIVSYSGAGDGRVPCTDQQVASKYIGSYAFVSKLSPDGSSLVYSTYLGGSYQIDGRTQACNGPVNYGTGIAIDASGNAYVTGFTDTADFPLSGGDTTPAMFVAKLNPSGSSVLYVSRVRSFLAGTASSGIAVGGDGSAYVTGRTQDADFPATAGAYQTECRACNFSVIARGTDAFVLKVNPSGAIVWASYLGSSGSSGGYGIAVDGTGQPVIVGATNTGSPVPFPFPTTAGAVQATAGTDGGALGGSDVFVSRFNASGSDLVFSTYLDGNRSDTPGGVAIGGDGGVYVTGGTASNEFPTTSGAYLSTYPGGVHAFVTKLSATGGLVYSTFLGAASAQAGDERGVGIAVDGVGRAFVAGNTDAADFPAVDAIEGVDQLFPGQSSIFLSVLKASGAALDFSTYLGGHSFSLAQSVALGSSNGSAYIVGTTNAVDCCLYPTTEHAFQRTPSSSQIPNSFAADVFVTRVQVAAMLPPNCSAGAASISSLWPPDHKMVPINIVGVTDPMNLALTISVTGIQQDEPTNGLGDGDTPVDGSGVGTAQARVRAERSGRGDGRIYKIAFRATNANGVSCNGAATVAVPANQGPGRVPVDSGVRYDSTAP